MEDDDWGSYPIVMSIPVKQKQSQKTLPFDPFVFELTLFPIKCRFSKDFDRQFTIKPGYVVGKTGKDINIEYPNVSRNHCKFEENTIQDLGSASGTFIAMTAKEEKVIQVGDIYMIGKCQMKILSWSKGSKLQYSMNGHNEQVRVKQERILIGSSHSCDIVHTGLDEIHGEISSLGIIKQYQDDEHIDFDKGIWLRLSQKSKQSRKHEIKQGTIIKIDPIIFKLMY